MRRAGHLYARAFTRDALLAAYHDAARHKSGASGCYNFGKRLAANLDRLHAQLAADTYRPEPYETFWVYEPKPRQIFAPTFADLVVQHAIYRVVYPLFDAAFIDQSFACRVGYGTHRASDYAQRALQLARPGTVTLKIDVRKFFYRIDRAVLRGLIERRIKDRRFVDAMMLFADHGEPQGIPIGNLLSQLYALVYLNPLDHFVKRVLRVRHYCRYVDDAICFDLTPDEAVRHLAAMRAFLADRLHLELSKWTIAPRRRGVNFVGYRTWRTRRFIRKHSLYRFSRAVRDGQLQSTVSSLGHARRTGSLQYLLTTCQERSHALYRQLPPVYRRAHHPRLARASG